MSEAAMTTASYTVHLCPPTYPEDLFPFRCRHEGPFQMMAGARGGRRRVELDSPMCMACGSPLPGTHGNVFSCIAECYAHIGHNLQIGRQLLYIRRRYLRLALRLFDANGWNGRHRKWAELIDPNLTMRVEPRGANSDGITFVSVSIDDSYFSSRGAA